MSRNGLLWTSLFAVLGLACKSSSGGGGSGGDAVVTPSTYVATSGEGDLAVWTVADGGGSVTVVLTKVDTSGNPVDGGTHTIAGSCGARDAVLDYRKCTISSVTPVVANSGSPKAGDQYVTLELPGVAYIAHPTGSQSGDKRHDLHVGVIAASCHNITGSYNMVHVGPPGTLIEGFGQFSLTGANDGTVSAVTHYDYGMVVNGAYSDNSSSDPIKVALLTDEFTISIADGGSTCANGVTTIALPAGGGSAVFARATVTNAGALLIDLPRGLGGIIGISAASAATLSDLRNRDLFIVAYEGDDSVNLMRVRVGDAGEVTFVADVKDGGPEDDGGLGRMVALGDSSLTSYFGAGSWVDSKNMTSATVDGGFVNTWSPPDGGRASSPAPSTLSGFFTIVDNQGRPFIEKGRPIILAAQKADGGIFLSGVHMGVNNDNSGKDSDGGYTRCFSKPRPDGTPDGRKNDRQSYCIDGPFVGYSR
ncbi:MAG: hypothetical protein HYY84_10425 [Deltaproteobacteria bacterium]|nr:hypothetical protein [Deltaproteobacteria bacterium]